MGVNNDNPCPVCGSVYSDYAGNSIFTCRNCGNMFNNETKVWDIKKPLRQTVNKETYKQWCGRLIRNTESIKEADCENCDHPAECDECLAEFNARVTRKELSVAAKIFTDNVRLAEENDALKKLFIAEHREKAELLKSNALHKSRENNLLKKIKELEASNG